MEKVEYIEPILENESDEICADVHSSGIGAVIVLSIVISVLWPPTPVY